MLERKSYFIREHVGMLKLTDTYDILDPDTQAQIGIAKEEPGGLIVALRFLVNKQMLPTKVCVYEGDSPEDPSKIIFTISRGFTFLRSQVNICDRSGNVLGWFKSKFFTLGGAFTVYDSAGNQVAMVKGDWKGWNFRFLDQAENEMGSITKKWAGVGKELFTSADNYMITLNGAPDPSKALLLLAAGLAVDTVYKESR